MRYGKRAVLAATPQEVWSLVEDVAALATCVPGLESFERQDATHFTSVVAIGVGPVKARFRLASELAELDPPRRLVVLTEGADSALGSRVRQRQVVTLVPVGEGTEASIELELQIGGRIATFGQRIIEAKAEEFASEVLTRVEALLATRRST